MPPPDSPHRPQAPRSPYRPAGLPDPPASQRPQAPHDPLRLCVFATIALLGWLLGPLAVLVFATVGFAGYLSARRAGLTHSRCVLRDTRLVLAYLALLVLVGLGGVAWWFLSP